jgi:hypothetical protein
MTSKTSSQRSTIFQTLSIVYIKLLVKLPTFNTFTLHGYSEIYPGAVVVAEIPVVAESTEGITRSAT